jgi:uncharacterized protein
MVRVSYGDKAKTVFNNCHVTYVAVAHAVSCDFTEVPSLTDEMICQNPKISKLDERLIEVYKEVRKVDAPVVEEQKLWLKEAVLAKMKSV